ncbi:MAG: AMP-binding protein [Bacteroidales bacterium]|nr:AMP-binding protein [Bacteroidales bacterium]
MITKRFSDYLTDGIKNNWNTKALSDYKGITLTYGEIARRIADIRLIFEAAGLKKGDKVALVGKNSVHWAVVYLAGVLSEMVVVPILPDFKVEAVEHIINHSESRLLFASDQVRNAITSDNIPKIEAVFSIEELLVVSTKSESIKKACSEKESLFQKKFPNGFSAETFISESIDNSKLAVISYTSGTSGSSKGVMLSHNSLAANMQFAQNNMPLKAEDDIVSFLPLAHAFGCAFEFLFPFTLGCHITFLTKTPSPQIIMEAFKVVRPRLILSVPLVIEKIYKKQISPLLKKPAIQFLMKIPGANQLLYSKIRKKLYMVFGGNFTELVVGGAALSQETEQFFRKIGFPFTVGYGMTECGPLISYTGWKKFKLESAGKTVDTMEARIDSEDPQRIEGEILVRGENVMNGYFKNQKATDDVLDQDGWLHTGDMGLIDEDGMIFIKGRVKNMILGASGQNIYPEEIESVINNRQLVLESVVIEENGKIIAMVVPDQEVMRIRKLDKESLAWIFETYRQETNKKLPVYMQVSKFVIHEEEFEKTPKKSIKRYMYVD